MLVAVSGGADSIGLLRLLADATKPEDRRKLVVVHFNHRLRVEASDEDMRFVLDLADRLDVSCCAGTISNSLTSNMPGGQGLESLAREQRYAFFREVATEREARYLVTAHHRDDQAETVLHRILRGTGIAGLGGIHPAREWMPGVGLVRPLLSFSRAEIVEYLCSIDQPWREDATNHSTEFTRNRIRHELLPHLREAYGEQIEQSVLRLGQQARDCQEMIDSQVASLWERGVEATSPHAVRIAAGKLADVHPYLVRELFIRVWDHQVWSRQDMTQLHWHKLSTLVERENSTTADTLPGNIRVAWEGDCLILRKADPEKDV